MIKKEDILNDMFNTNKNDDALALSTKKPTPRIDNDNEDSMSDLSITLTKFELPKDQSDITIMQSRDVSSIDNVKRVNFARNEPNINLDKLLDMTSTIEFIEGEKNSINGEKLNIKVPNPKKSDKSTKRKEKLILLDEKENKSMISTKREKN